jgi:heptosyltransferase-2/heptosyltransferase-3
MPDAHPLVCRFGAFGDMVMVTPLLELLYLRSGLPCDLVAIGAWNEQLFKNLPWVRDVLSIDSRSKPYLFNRAQRKLVQTLRQRQYRFAWICETNQKSYRLLARAGIGRDNSCSQLDLPPIEGEHYRDKWLRLGNQSPPGFDYPPQPTDTIDTGLIVVDDEIAECRRWLQSRGIEDTAPLICIQPGSKRTMRRGKADRDSNTKYWPESNWAAVIDGILAQLPAAQILLCGVGAEAEMCRAIEIRCHSLERVHNVAGDLPMRRLLALLSIAHSCVSVDTGPAHAAAALNCPLVVLFGQASPERFRPISAASPVRLLIGQATQSGQPDPDIAHITPAQVLAEWGCLP